MKQHIGAAWDLRLASEEQILAMLDRYDFRDTLGHPLRNCQEFMEIITAYIRLRQELESLYEKTLG